MRWWSEKKMKSCSLWIRFFQNPLEQVTKTEAMCANVPYLQVCSQLKGALEPRDRQIHVDNWSTQSSVALTLKLVDMSFLAVVICSTCNFMPEARTPLLSDEVEIVSKRSS